MDFKHEENRIFLENHEGQMVAEVTFYPHKDNVYEINHTFVDNSLRGQGVASLLLEEVSKQFRTENKKAYPTCSYAVQWFQKNTDYSDVLAN